jgi:hypothetical protein
MLLKSAAAQKTAKKIDVKAASLQLGDLSSNNPDCVG